MHASIELAEIRRRDMLAEAARYRLTRQAQPTEQFVSPAEEVLWSAIQAMHASARGAVAALFVYTLRWSSEKSAPTILTSAR